MELPKGWIKTILGDITISEKGKKPKTLGEQSSKNIYPYIDIKAFEKGEIRQYTDGEKCRLCEKDDILIVWDGARSGLIGKAINGAIGSTLARVKSKVVDNNYLYYFLFGNYNKINTNTKGIGIPHVDPNYLWNLTFLLPPLPEQHRIVEKIEELFSELDNGIAQLKKAKQQIKTYRQAVLKAAFEGKIVRKSKKDKLINITSKIGSGSTPKGGKENYKESGIPLIRSMNIHFDFIKYAELAFIDENQAKRLKNVIVNQDDVLLNITGASIGRVNIAPKEFHNGRVNQHVSIIRPKDNSFYSKYLKFFIQSPNIQDWISKSNYGATRQALTKSMLENLEVPLPSYEEQQQIVSEIEQRFSVADKLEESINKSLLHAEAMRQSILKKAFEGKLVPQNEQDEPAEKLLERIKRLSET